MTDAHGIARDQLRSFIERIERLEEEKKSIADDIKDVYGEAKGTGFDTKILREVIKIRKQDKDERAEREALLDTYMIALGMIAQPDFFDDEPQEREPVARKTAALLRSDGGLNILTKHEDIRTAPETAEEAEPEAAAEVAGNDLREPAAAEQGQIIREGDAPRETGHHDDGDASCPDTEFSQPKMAAQCAAPERDAAADKRDVEASGGAALVRTHSDQPLTGGDHEVAGIAPRERETVTSNTGEGAAKPALPANPAERPKSALRPHCKNPGDNCGGFGSTHCHDCLKARQEEAA